MRVQNLFYFTKYCLQFFKDQGRFSDHLAKITLRGFDSSLPQAAKMRCVRRDKFSRGFLFTQKMSYIGLSLVSTQKIEKLFKLSLSLEECGPVI